MINCYNEIKKLELQLVKVEIQYNKTFKSIYRDKMIMIKNEIKLLKRGL